MPRLCAYVAAALTVVAAAGCASHKARHRNARAVDWESEETQAQTGVAANTLVRPAAPNVENANVSATNSGVANRPPAVAGTTNAHEPWLPLNRWCAVEHLPLPSRFSGGSGLTYGLRATNGTMLLNAGSRVASWEGLEFRLGFAPAMFDSQIYVHALDLQKTVQPLLGDALPALVKTNPVVVIDPGHGGENAGAPSIIGRRYEKEFTLDWAIRLAPLLQSNGWTVFLTRTNDTDLALSNRVNFAETHKADLFLSLHFNSAGGDESQKGLETYCLTPAGMLSSVTRDFSDDPALTFPNNTFDDQNLVLAARVHRALLAAGMRDRGVRRARFPGVLRGQQRPAILIEGGYISNREEAGLIAQGAHRQKLAEAIGAALQAPTSYAKQSGQESAGGR